MSGQKGNRVSHRGNGGWAERWWAAHTGLFIVRTLALREI